MCRACMNLVFLLCRFVHKATTCLPWPRSVLQSNVLQSLGGNYWPYVTLYFSQAWLRKDLLVCDPVAICVLLDFAKTAMLEHFEPLSDLCSDLPCLAVIYSWVIIELSSCFFQLEVARCWWPDLVHVLEDYTGFVNSVESVHCRVLPVLHPM